MSGVGLAVEFGVGRPRRFERHGPEDARLLTTTKDSASALLSGGWA